MIEPLDRSRRDATLFRFTTGRLPDIIDPNHRDDVLTAAFQALLSA